MTTTSDASIPSSTPPPSVASPTVAPVPSVTPALTISSVSAKLPSFWPGDVELWFSLCEAEFDACRITRQETRFGHIARTLPPEVAQEVRDLIVSRPTTDPYDALKDAVIKRTSVSEQRRLRELLSDEELGDRKPSQLLRRMRQLLGQRKFDDTLLRQLFLQRLPAQVQSILAVSKDSVSLEDMAELADRILDVQPPEPPRTVAELSRDHLSERLSRLERMVERLTEQLSSTVIASRGRSSSRRRGKNHAHAKASSNPETELCWYHRKFGDKAERCVSPCAEGNGRAQQ